MHQSGATAPDWCTYRAKLEYDRTVLYPAAGDDRADPEQELVRDHLRRRVDADLDSVRDPALLKKHPGLARPSGHIGLLGHGTRVEFRNIRIQELP